MKVRNCSAIVVAVAMAIGLSGCAGIGKKAVEVTPRAQVAPVGSLEATALEAPETVWVPARYRADGKAALFLSGRQYATPAGYSNAAGFLPNSRGYLVAVLQPRLEGATSGERADNYLAFYQVDQQGRTQARIGAVPNVLDVVVAPGAIYAETNASRAERLRSYVGRTATGEPVTGPQGVLSAAPAPGGGWYIARVLDDSEGEIDVGLYHRSDSGGTQQVAVRRWDADGYNAFVRTTGAFVNQPPVADTARTGYWPFVAYRSNVYSPRDSRYFIKSFDMEHKAAERPLGLAGDIGSLGAGDAVSLAERSLLVELGDQDLVGMQLSPGSFDGLYWGFAPAEEGFIQLGGGMNANMTGTPIYRLAGEGGNLLRTVLTGNGARMTLNALNDVYGVITPESVVVFPANDLIVEHGVGLRGYDVRREMAIPAEQAQEFLNEYGFDR